MGLQALLYRAMGPTGPVYWPYMGYGPYRACVQAQVPLTALEGR